MNPESANNPAYLKGLDAGRLPSPCTVIDLQALENNLKILRRVKDESGAKILLALKGVACVGAFPLMRLYLDGCCASSLHEAMLAEKEFGGEVHSFSPGYEDSEIKNILAISSHMVFNSFRQLEHFRPLWSKAKDVSAGLRVNPGHSEADVALYDPCAPGSRLGIPASMFIDKDLTGVEGLHFHALCQKGADALERTFAAFEKNFSEVLHRMNWLNMGGGHHITAPDYDVSRLISLIRGIQSRYDLEVYLEPGEAVGINTGSLFTTIIDIVNYGGVRTAILDLSVTCHMPDVLEMPYHPDIRGAKKPGEAPNTYRFGGVSCLAGDYVGDYAFDQELEIGQKIEFLDMTHYTTVKTSTFNGVRLPAVAYYDSISDELWVTRESSYEDYRSRLG